MFEKIVLVVFLSILTIFAGVIIWTTIDPVFENRRAIANLQASANVAVTNLSNRITALENRRR